jgi:probable rRNA maturation factor
MNADGPARSRAAPALTVQVATRSRRLPTQAQLRRWTRAALAKSVRAQVTLRIVGEREGESLNREFRRKPHATNVLTFGYGKHGGRGELAGDIVLCAPVIAREARLQGKPLEAHYAHLTVHGLLHLQGYDHEKSREARVMEAKEAAILRRLGYPDPYAGEERQVG